MARFLQPLPEPDMKFSLIRLSTGQSNARIPQCQCVGERPKRHRSGMDLATNGGRVNGITASPQPFRSCRTPGYRPFAPAGSVVPPFITTMTCSDFRSRSATSQSSCL